MIKRTFFLGIGCLLLIFCSSVPLTAENTDWLEAIFWVELDPVPQEGEEYPVTREAAARRALEEARFVFSGMIFGYRFLYVPSDKTRQVEEHFTLELLHQIPWGDPGLVAKQAVPFNENRLTVRIRYNLSEHHSYRLNSWQSTIYPVSSGAGEGTAMGGYKEKITAIKEAVKAAIRSYGREAVYNKPREMSGEVLLVESPYIIINEGSYLAKVKIKLKGVEILPYRSF